MVIPWHQGTPILVNLDRSLEVDENLSKSRCLLTCPIRSICWCQVALENVYIQTASSAITEYKPNKYIKCGSIWCFCTLKRAKCSPLPLLAQPRSGPPSNIISLRYQESPPEQDFDTFSHFCTAEACDRLIQHSMGSLVTNSRTVHPVHLTCRK